MSAGLPCVASRIRGNVDLVKDGTGGYLCDPNDVAGFAKAIGVLASDSELRRMMGSANLQAIREFDIDVVRSTMKEIYVSALQRASTESGGLL